MKSCEACGEPTMHTVCAKCREVPRCFICYAYSAEGFHIACILESLKEEINGKQMSGPCDHCPFVRTEGWQGNTWMDRGRLLLNQARLHLGLTQNCHRNDKYDHECYGAQKCLEGGDETFISLDELERLKPCDPSEAWARYNEKVLKEQMT